MPPKINVILVYYTVHQIDIYLDNSEVLLLVPLATHWNISMVYKTLSFKIIKFLPKTTSKKSNVRK